MDVINNSTLWMNEQLQISWTHGSRCYPHIKVVDDMNDFMSWAWASRYVEQLKFVDDMNDFGSWAQGFRSYV